MVVGVVVGEVELSKLEGEVEVEVEDVRGSVLAGPPTYFK
jgi:hypothetical protein